MRHRPRSALEYARLLWRRKHIAALVALPLMASGVLALRGVADVYQSSALVILAPQYAASDAEVGLVRSTSYELTSRTTLLQLIEAHQLYPWRKDVEDALREMRKDITVDAKHGASTPQVPEAFRLTFRYRDASQAQKVVQSLTEAFTAANALSLRHATVEVEAVNVLVSSLERDIALRTGAPSALAAAPATPAAAALSPRLSDEERRRRVAARQALEDRGFMLEQQMAEQRRVIAAQQQLAERAGDSPQASPDGTLGPLLVRKAELAASIAAGAERYTEQNPKLAGARAQLAEVNQLITQFESRQNGRPAAEDVRELEGLRRHLAQLDIEMNLVRLQLQREPPVTPADAALSALDTASGAAGAELGALLGRYGALLERRERLRTRLAGGGPALFAVVDAPNLPTTPGGPDRMAVWLLLCAGSAGVGIGIAAVREFLALPQIRDAADIQYFLGAAVFAHIPLTLPAAEQQHRRRQSLLRWTWVGVAAVAIVPGLVGLWTRLGVLQVVAERFGG